MKFKKFAKAISLSILSLLTIGAIAYGVESVEDHKLDK